MLLLFKKMWFMCYYCICMYRDFSMIFIRKVLGYDIWVENLNESELGLGVCIIGKVYVLYFFVI